MPANVGYQSGEGNHTYEPGRLARFQSLTDKFKNLHICTPEPVGCSLRK